jgi:hypothetical protein
MQTRIHLLTSIVAAVLTCGCAASRPGRIVSNVVGSAGGAIAGRALGKGESLPTALGAGAGLLTSEVLNFGIESSQKRNFADGYEKGRSDSAKRTYQSLVEQQRIGPVAAEESRVSVVEIPVPERTVRGVHFAPATATLRILE